MRRSLAGIETKPPQTRWSLTGDHFSSPFCRHGLYFLYFDDGEDAALLSGIVIANHLDGLISDDKSILHSAVSPSTRGLCALSKSTALECCEGWSDFQVLCRRQKVQIKIYVYLLFIQFSWQRICPGFSWNSSWNATKTAWKTPATQETWEGSR